MKPLSEAQLARMRAQLNARLPGTAVIQQAIRTPDGAGGWSETWTAVTGGTVACRLDPIGVGTVRETSIALRETLVVRYRLTVPYDAPLAADFRVVINGKTYEIVQLDDQHSQRVSRRAVVAEAH
jgi:head-tail adaptor